jgi:hypothetical protein
MHAVERVGPVRCGACGGGGGGVAPAGHGDGGNCRVAWTGERGGACGPRVENVGQPGMEGTGPAREKQCRIFNK